MVDGLGKANLKKTRTEDETSVKGYDHENKVQRKQWENILPKVHDVVK